MKTYVVSDLHGRYDLYLKLLDTINLGEKDTLYILGDSLDRGNDGIKILQDIRKHSNIKCLLGNHEDMFATLYEFKKKSEKDEKYVKEYANQLVLTHINGGGPTRTAFEKLSSNEQEDIVKWIREWPFFNVLILEDKTFFLSHSVPNKDTFTKWFNGKIKDNIDDFIWGEQEYDKKYCEDMYIVTGHTPTELIDESKSGEIIEKNNNLAIDCGAFFTNTLGCLCLNTMERIYIK